MKRLAVVRAIKNYLYVKYEVQLNADALRLTTWKYING